MHACLARMQISLHTHSPGCTGHCSPGLEGHSAFSRHSGLLPNDSCWCLLKMVAVRGLHYYLICLYVFLYLKLMFKTKKGKARERETPMPLRDMVARVGPGAGGPW